MLSLPKISIRVNVLTVILLVSAVIASSLLFSQYYFSQKLAIESTHKTFELIFKNITEHLRIEGDNTRNMLLAKREQSELLEPITFDPFHPALHSLVDALQVGQNLYAIYFAQPNGHFLKWLICKIAQHFLMFIKHHQILLGLSLPLLITSNNWHF